MVAWWRQHLIVLLLLGWPFPEPIGLAKMCSLVRTVSAIFNCITGHVSWQTLPICAGKSSRIRLVLSVFAFDCCCCCCCFLYKFKFKLDDTFAKLASICLMFTNYNRSSLPSWQSHFPLQISPRAIQLPLLHLKASFGQELFEHPSSSLPSS